MRGYLSVRINDGTTDRHVTSNVRDLRFTKAAPGGYMSASMKVVLPRATFPNLGPNDKVYIYDARTGQTIFEGFAKNPGMLDGPAGQAFDIEIAGTATLASDQSMPLLYIDKRFDRWNPGGAPNVAASATTGAGTSPTTGNPALTLQFNPGQPVSTGSLAQIWYDARPMGAKVGGYQGTWYSGVSDASYEHRYVFELAAGGPSVNWFLTTPTTTSGRLAITHYTPGPAFVALQLVRTGGPTNVTGDNVWTALESVSVVGQLINRSGAYVVSPSLDYIQAHHVVEDLLGRSLNFTDPILSTVAAGTHQIDQLIFEDGATAAEVLDQLSLYEPDMLWEILHSTPRGHVFRYRPWPTTARYEISVRDGYDAPGGDADLCNRIAIYWDDKSGVRQTAVVGAHVPELGSKSPVLPGGAQDPTFQGRIRDAEPVTLPDGQGSAANAQRIGQQALAAKSRPPKAGKAVIRRPILDRDTGNMVMPWEIEPGCLVTVRETGDSLRCTEVEYVDTECAATLTLGEPVLTVEQMVAALRQKVK